MKAIVSVNVDIPTVQDALHFSSDGSLRDYDIIVFSPRLPHYSRIEFSGGGSCISIEGAKSLFRAMSHWSRELSDALASGKTVFFLMSALEEDMAATGSTSSKSVRNYSTSPVNNYSVLPAPIRVRNARGRGIVVKSPPYKSLYNIIEPIAEYRVVIEDVSLMRPIFAARDGTPVGALARFKDFPGSLVLLPNFEFRVDEFTKLEHSVSSWTEVAIKTSHALVGQLIAIDRMLKGSAELTPPPDWLREFQKPKGVSSIDTTIATIDHNINKLEQQREEQLLAKAVLLDYSHLLYESGKPLERAIEKALRLLGYAVETLRIGDLEIDHVIVGPSGKRMIGESEGKDSSAIDISKFRQLESNIGEDFEREEVDQPAKGLLFGNGYRLSAPEERAEQFTQKSLTNARRLGSALIRTSDLYAVALHLLDNPKDEAFRAACRLAIENTTGGIVEFPEPAKMAAGGQEE